MRTILRNLAGSLLVAAAALGTGQPQSATQEIRPRDFRAQQPKEVVSESAPCQRAREAPRGRISQDYVIDPSSLVPDLKTLVDMSDDVILAGVLDRATVLSPSGESTATYLEVRVIRRWKGSHHAGDTLTFGLPIGAVGCELTPQLDGSRFEVTPENNFGFSAPKPLPLIYVLFVRKSRGNESQFVQGLRLTAGDGLQGIFGIEVPGSTNEEPVTDCDGGQKWSWQRCDGYVKTSQSPVLNPNSRDPLAKTYRGMPAAEFLQVVQSVAAGQARAEEPPSN
jgi:hypothetical protein